MPSDEKVEKVKNAIRDAVGCHTTTGRPGVGCMTMDVPELCSCWVAAKAALAAAEAGERPVERIATKRTSEGTCGGQASHIARPHPSLYASPPSEASREERAAIRKEAFEEAAKVARMHAHHALWGAKIGYGWSAETEAAIAAVAGLIATAIRERGEG